MIEEAISLYSGDYLANDDFNWAFYEREILRTEFTSIAKSLISYYIRKTDYIAAQKVFKGLLAIIIWMKTAHEMLLRTIYFKNDRAAFFKHYEKLKELFKQDLGVTLCKPIQELYGKLMSEKTPH